MWNQLIYIDKPISACFRPINRMKYYIYNKYKSVVTNIMSLTFHLNKYKSQILKTCPYVAYLYVIK